MDSYSVVKLQQTTQMFMMVDHVKEMTVKKSCMAKMDRLSSCSSWFVWFGLVWCDFGLIWGFSVCLFVCLIRSFFLCSPPPPPFSSSSCRFVGLVAKSSTSRAAKLDSIPTFAVDILPGRVIPEAQKQVLQWLPCQAPGNIESALGMTGPVSVYCV